jgi:hypothetical protein
MSSIKTDYERLEKLVKDGGKWERSFRKKTFRKFTGAELEQMKEEMRRMLAAHTPTMHQLTKDVACPTPDRKTGQPCGHAFYKIDDWIPQGVMLLKCPQCGERHSLKMRPEKPTANHQPPTAVQ